MGRADIHLIWHHYNRAPLEYAARLARQTGDIASAIRFELVLEWTR